MSASESLISHLIELRARLLNIAVALLLVFVCLFPWASDLYALLARPLLALLRMNDDVVLGVATGIAAHGIGTARVFQISETAGAFAGLAMGLTGFVTAVVAPLLVHFLLS